MSENLLNILSNSNKDIDNQTLMAYLKGELPPAEAHELEEKMLQSDFITDAVEGLDKFKNPNDAGVYADKINREFQKRLAKKKLRKEKRKWKDMPWVYYSIILILLLAILSFIILRYHLS